MKNLYNKKYKFSWRHTYLPLLIVPLILGLILSVMVFQVTRGQMRQTGQMSVEKFYTQASSIVNELNIVRDSLLSNDQFIEIITRDSVSDQDVRAVIRMIHNSLSKNAYIQETIIVSKSLGMTYTGDAHYSYTSFEALMLQAVGYIDRTVTITEDSLEEGWGIPINDYSSPYLVSFINDSEGNKKATMVVVLNKAYLYRSLFVTNSAFCCMYNSDFLISSKLNSDPDYDYTSASDISRLVGGPVELFSLEDEHFTYLTALKRSDFYRPLYIILISFGAYFLVILIFAAIHIRNANKREKEFFSSLIDELPQPETKRSNSDINAIFESISTALNNYKEEHTAFSEQKKYNNLNMLALGYPSIDIYDESAGSMDIDLNAKCYYMARFHYSEVGIMDSAHRNDLTCIITETSLNGFAGGRFKAVCFPLRNGDVCGILNVYKDDLKSKDIRIEIQNVMKMLSKDYGIVFKCSLSAPVTDTKDIPPAFNETLDLFRFIRAVDSNMAIISADEMMHSPAYLIRGEYLKQMQILAGTLLLGKFELVPGMVDAILEEHVATLRKNYIYADERLKNVISLLLETPLPSYVTSEEAEELRSRLRAADSISTLSQIVHDFFGSLSSTENVDTLVEKTRDYIAGQISNDMLSVPEIAEHAGVSVQHLSKRFKMSTGMTMVEYINTYRINMAKDLLASTDLNQMQIAEQTGYCNNVTFIRNFKKYVGCTPSEYRARSSR